MQIRTIRIQIWTIRIQIRTIGKVFEVFKSKIEPFERDFSIRMQILTIRKGFTVL